MASIMDCSESDYYDTDTESSATSSQPVQKKKKINYKPKWAIYENRRPPDFTGR